MPSRAGAALRVRARSAARRLHRVSHAPWFDQFKAVGATRREPVPEMPCADANSRWPRERPTLYRQTGPLLFPAPGRLLERRLPSGHPWVEHQPQNALLRKSNQGMNHRATIYCGVLLATLLPPAALGIRGAEIDTGALPAAAKAAVDFDRDVKSIFESTCFRCHGPEKPKARFRLDN